MKHTFARTFAGIFFPLLGFAALMAFVGIPLIIAAVAIPGVEKLPETYVKDLEPYLPIAAHALASEDRDALVGLLGDLALALNRDDIEDPDDIWFLRLRLADGTLLREYGPSAALADRALAEAGLTALPVSGLRGTRTQARGTPWERYVCLVQIPITDGSGKILGAFEETMALDARDIAPGILGGNAGLMFVVFLVFLAVFLLASIILSLSLSRRIAKIRLKAERYASGDFSDAARSRRRDDLGRLEDAVAAIGSALPGLLEKRQEYAAMEERNRIARDLHDGVKQDLAGLSFGLAALAGRGTAPVSEEAIAALGQAARRALSDMDDFLKEIGPFVPDAESLPRLLRAEADSAGRISGIAIGCSISEPPPAMDGSTAAAFYWTAREALSNCVRHSGASSVILSLGPGEDGAPILSVEDDGSGFDPATAARGLGLDSMRARLRQARAALSVDSSPGRGCRITAIGRKAAWD